MVCYTTANRKEVKIMDDKKLLQKFKKLLLDKHSLNLSDEEAKEMFTRFLNMMKVITKPKSAQSN